MRLFELAVEGAHLTRQFEGELVADPLDRGPRGERAQERFRIRSVEFLGCAVCCRVSARRIWWLAGSLFSANADNGWMPVWYVATKWG